jgi:hypothetical protein
MEFDDFGNLTPYGKIDSDLETGKKKLVEDFAPQNQKRKELWSHLATYNARIKNLMNTDWEQWIDGSFVTRKQEPNDIDLVNFIEYSDDGNERLSANWDEAKNLFAMEEGAKSSSYNSLKMDGYLEPIYPASHPLYNSYQRKWNYWNKWFGYNKENERPKGFLSIKHTRG